MANKWVCTVCGYVHTGDSAPGGCPVCGVGPELFKASEEGSKTSSEDDSEEGDSEDDPPSGLRCLNCNAPVNANDSACGVCGSSTFGAKSANSSSNKRRYIIVGAGIAGVTAAEQIRKNDPIGEIVLITNEQRTPYYRLNLTRMLAGEVTEQNLPLHNDSWYKEQNINLKTGATVTGLNVSEKTIDLQTGETVHWDKLIIASGASPFVPPISGIKEYGTTLRTADDIKQLLSTMDKKQSYAILGGGILGLEIAGALAQQGKSVTILEGFQWILPRQLNKEAAQEFESMLMEKFPKIKIVKNVKAKAFRETSEGIVLDTESGEPVTAEHFIITVGVRPDVEIFAKAGLKKERGLIVNDKLQTSHPDIYCCGDACEHRGMLYGTWAPAQQQGTIAGKNASGEIADYQGYPISSLLKVVGIPMFSIGKTKAEDGSSRWITTKTAQAYQTFLLRDGIIEGAILLKDSSSSAAVKAAIEQHIVFQETSPDELIKRLGTIKAL